MGTIYKMYKGNNLKIGVKFDGDNLLDIITVMKEFKQESIVSYNLKDNSFCIDDCKIEIGEIIVVNSKEIIKLTQENFNKRFAGKVFSTTDSFQENDIYIPRIARRNSVNFTYYNECTKRFDSFRVNNANKVYNNNEKVSCVDCIFYGSSDCIMNSRNGCPICNA